jgi:hypothetical protein
MEKGREIDFMLINVSKDGVVSLREAANYTTTESRGMKHFAKGRMDS